MGILSEKEPDSESGKGRLVFAVVGLVVLAAVAASFWLWQRDRAASVGHAPRRQAKGRAPSPKPASAKPVRAAGRIEVEASEPGARVRVDGRESGPAPLVLELRAGSHSVRIEKEGFRPFERELQVIPGRSLRLVARLEAEAPRLRIDSDVPGASVFLDRRPVGVTPLEVRDATPGSHRLTVTAEGHEMWSETIELHSGAQQVMVRFKEVRLDEALEVAHKHAVGSCRGRLLASTEGLRYETAEAKDAFRASLATFEPLQVDYLKRNLRLKQRGGKTYNFTSDSADALLAFQRAVESARKRL